MSSINTISIEQLARLVGTPKSPRLVDVRTAEDFAADTGAAIRHGGNQAFYSVTHDHVQMPPFASFRDAESYYATLLHELTHWTRPT